MGRGDEVEHFGAVGCLDLLHEVQQRIKPRIHIFGHIHEGNGISSDGTTLFVNASSVNEEYLPINPCIVLDVPKDASKPVVVVQPHTNLSQEQLIAWFKKYDLLRPIVPILQNLEYPLNGQDMLTKSINDLCYMLSIRTRKQRDILMRARVMFHVDCFS